MAALAAASALNTPPNGTLDPPSQPGSKAPSPASPTASLQLQQALPPRALVNLHVPVRNGPGPPTPATPTAASHLNASGSSGGGSGSLLDPPAGMPYKEFLGTWSDAHVAHWLADVRCAHHASTFRVHDIRGDVLLELDQTTLREMGLASIGDRLRILNGVKQLRQRASTRPPSMVQSPSPLFRSIVVTGDNSQAHPYHNHHHRQHQDAHSPKPSGSGAELTASSRLAMRSGRPAPLQLSSSPRRNNLPRIVHDAANDPARGANSNVRPLPQPAPNGPGPSSHGMGVSPVGRTYLPPLPPPPRGQPPALPKRAVGLLSAQAPGGRRTPTQGDVPAFVNQPLPPAPTVPPPPPPQQQGPGVVVFSPSSAATPAGSAPWSATYGLPADPRPGNAGGKTPVRAGSPLSAQSPIALAGASAAGAAAAAAAMRLATRSPGLSHTRNGSLGLNSPTASMAGKLPARPSTSGHPYATSTSAGTSAPAAGPQPISLQPPANPGHALSPIAESFLTSSPATPSPMQSFAVGRGPFGAPSSSAGTRPGTPSHAAAPSLDDLRRMLVRFQLPVEGSPRRINVACKINVADCAGGVEVLEKVLKKFGKLAGRGFDDAGVEHVSTDEGGLSVDGWGVYLDWDQEDAQDHVSDKPLSEAELMAICHASPDNPARENGLWIRRTGKKPLMQMFGDVPSLHLRGDSPTTPPGGRAPSALSTAADDEHAQFLALGPADAAAEERQERERARERRNTKRASTISILSGLGVPDPEKALESPSSPTLPVSSRLAPPTPSSAATAGPSSKKPSRLRNFFGQRPPSELITTHLAEYFPFTEKKVLERTARHSIYRPSRAGGGGGGGGGGSKRDSTASWNPPSISGSRSSRYSTVSLASHRRRQSPSPSRASVISVPPPVPEKPRFVGEQSLAPASPSSPQEALPEEDDGHSTDDMPPAPEIAEPAAAPESLSDSTDSLARRRLSRASTVSRRLSFMTELRSRRDRADTASLLTVDEITAEVEHRRASRMDDSGEGAEDEQSEAESWTKVESEEGGLTVGTGVTTPDYSDEEQSAVGSDEEEDELANEDEDEEDEIGKPLTSKKGTKWIKGALIGAGSFGKVYLGMDASSGLLMAVKQVELPTGSAPNEDRKKSMLSALEREIELLKDLQHVNIVQYLYSSLEDDHLNIFLEYVPGGSVAALLQNYGAFEEVLVKNFVRQILEGLNYLHERDIIHRDIKGANILVDNKGGVKISDFGISKKVEDNLLNSKRMHRPSLQGSVFWMAPEVVKQTAHTRKADIWSVGCLVVEMLTGEHPWAQLSQMQAIFKIGSQSAKPTIPSDITPEAQDFLQRTFEINHEARPPAGELLHHPWIAPKKSSHRGNTPKVVLSAPTEVAATA